MSRYLLDTNHVSGVLETKPSLQKRIEQARGAEFGTSMPSIAELWYMVMYSTRVLENTDRLNTVLNGMKEWPFDSAAAKEFGVIKAELRQWGDLYRTWMYRSRRLPASTA
jgi:predicted nucleic acid-binding protein